MTTQKPQITAKTAPEYFLNTPKFSGSTPTPKGAAGYYAKMAHTLTDTLGKMQERNDKLAMTAFERKLASIEKTLLLQAGDANTTEAVDALYDKYKQEVDGIAKEMLGSRLYDTWNKDQSTNYYDIINDTMQRAKAPILQRDGDIKVSELIESAAKDRAMANSDKDRADIDAVVTTAIKFATYPEDGSMPIYNSTTGEAKLKTYRNKADLYALNNDAQINARETIKRIDSGYYKNLSAEQIQDEKAKVQKLVDKQEQEDLYAFAKAKYTDPKSGKVDYAKVSTYLNTQAEQDFNVSPDNAKVAADMAYARLNRDQNIKTAQERETLSNVYDKGFELYMGGDVESAIQYVLGSNIPWDDKHTLIEKFKEGQGEGGVKRSNPVVFSDLADRIVKEEIYDALPITQAYAKGDLTNADKEALIKLIGQVQEPSSVQYKRAMSQVDNAIKSGLFGYKQVDTDTKAYVRNQLTQEFRNAVKDGKTLQEIETMFNPVRVNAMISQAIDEYPSIRDSYNKQLQAERDEAAGIERVTSEYKAIQYAISKGEIKNHEELQTAIDRVEEGNTFLNTAEAQFNLEEQLNKVLDYYKKGVLRPDDGQPLVVTNKPEAEAIAKGTIGKPVLSLTGTPAIPGESIEEYTKRVQTR